MQIFRCPACGTGLAGWPPSLTCGACGHTLPVEDGVLIFSDEPNLILEGDRRYVGYDPVAEQYATCLHPEELAAQIYAGYGKAIVDLVGHGSLLLDVACGPGLYDIEIAKRGCKVIASDISINMLRILSSKMDEAPEHSLMPCRMNAYNLPLLDQSVDAVMTLQFLFLVSDPPRVINEIKRVLKPGGIFITDAPGEGGSPGSVIVGEIHARARSYYNEALQGRGVQELKAQAWSVRQIQENLPKFFSEHRIVESSDLVFNYKTTPRWFLQRLSCRYSAFQIGIDLEAHAQAMDEVRRRLIAEYGPDFEALEQEYHSVHRLNLYRV